MEAQESLNISTGELNVKASQDSSTSKSDSKDISGSVSMTMYSDAGPRVSLGYGEQHNTSETLNNNNSNLLADNINITTKNDANFEGATVRAEDTLNMDIGKDLNVISQRDVSSSNSKGFNLSTGVSLDGSGKKADIVNTGNGKIAGANASIGSNTGRTKVKQTVLSSLTGNKVNIKVENNTHLKGALIAAGKENKNGIFIDNENLDFETKTLTFANSTNSNFSSSNNITAGVSLSFNPSGKKDETSTDKEKEESGSSVSSSSLSLGSGFAYERTKTLATLGKGNIKIGDKENSDDLQRLNTDTTQVNKDMLSIDVSTSVDATLDHRVFSEEGRKDIKEDFERTKRLGQAISDVATKDEFNISDVLAIYVYFKQS